MFSCTLSLKILFQPVLFAVLFPLLSLVIECMEGWSVVADIGTDGVVVGSDVSAKIFHKNVQKKHNLHLHELKMSLMHPCVITVSCYPN